MLGAWVASHAQGRGYHYRFDEWQPKALQSLAVLEPDLLIVSEMPYNRVDIARMWLKMKSSQTPGIVNNYFRRLDQEVRSWSTEAKSPVYGEMGWRNLLRYQEPKQRKEPFRLESDLVGYLEWRPKLSFYFDFQADTNGGLDSDYQGQREWKSLSGSMRAAYLQYGEKRWSLLIGRDLLHWGPGFTGSLLTSGYAPPLDMIKLTLDFWNFRFTGFNALLSTNEAENQLNVNRYFSSHRLSLHLHRAELGISEALLYGGPNTNVKGSYLNLFIPYYFSDVMSVESKKDNVFLAFDASLYYPHRLRWYAQFLVDEFYYEGEDYPNRTAWLAGFDWMEAFAWPSLRLNFEYVRVDRWTYNYEAVAPWNRAVYFQSLLGHPLGPDADWLHVEPEVYLGRDILIRFSGNYIRHGETRIDDPLNSVELLHQNHVPFPYGAVEKTMSVGLAGEYFISNHWLFRFEYNHAQTENYGNQRGVTNDSHQFWLGVQHAMSWRWYE